jgi:hypothetical protein
MQGKRIGTLANRFADSWVPALLKRHLKFSQDRHQASSFGRQVAHRLDQNSSPIQRITKNGQGPNELPTYWLSDTPI